MSRKKTTKKGRKRRSKGNDHKRVILIVCGFILILFTTIYYLGHLKNRIEEGHISKRTETVDVESRVKELDKSISHTLFNLGITKGDIRESSVSVKKEGERSWTYKRRKFLVSKPGIDLDKFETELLQVVNSENTRGTVQKSGNEILFDIKVDELHTHRLIFDLGGPGVESEKSASLKKISQEKKKTASPGEQEFEEVFSEDKPKVVIIVDDLGRDKESVDRFARISPHLTFAVLPNLPNSAYAAEIASRNNIDLLLHLPMEPKTISGYNADDAGEGVLMVGQTKEDILQSLEMNLSAVPNVIGINNHMGSKFTENHELMELVLKKLHSRGLFFIDSVTSPNSRGYPIAREIGMKTARRDYFLDDKKKGKEYVSQQLAKLVEKSEKDGVAIGICHPYPQTIEAFEEAIPKLGKRVEIVPVSKVIN